MPVTAPESLPSPRGAHLEMVGAVLAGDGLERVAEIAAAHAGAPVAVIVPRLAAPVEAWAPLRALRGQAAGGRQARAARGGVRRGADRLGRAGARAPCCCSGRAGPMPASTCTWRPWRRSPRSRWPRRATRPSRTFAAPSSRSCSPATTSTRPTSCAARHGWAATSSDGAVGLCADPGERAPGRLLAAISGERPGRPRPDGGRPRLRTAARERRGRPPGGQPAGTPGAGGHLLPLLRIPPTSAARSRRPSWCWA